MERWEIVITINRYRTYYQTAAWYWIEDHCGRRYILGGSLGASPLRYPGDAYAEGKQEFERRIALVFGEVQERATLSEAFGNLIPTAGSRDGGKDAVEGDREGDNRASCERGIMKHYKSLALLCA
jgi:hypothetical protein